MAALYLADPVGAESVSRSEAESDLPRIKNAIADRHANQATDPLPTADVP